jgi:hypothetical protein
MFLCYKMAISQYLPPYLGWNGGDAYEKNQVGFRILFLP